MELATYTKNGGFGRPCAFALLCFLPYDDVYILSIYAHRCFMRTNIVIDDELMASAFKATGLTTKKDVVEQGLKLLVKRKKQQGIRNLRGKVKWSGDLDEMRGRK
jgi:Arc/MetJ family transcription regulator